MAKGKKRNIRRRGIEVLQLILVMPVLVLVLVAAIQFSTVLVVNSSLAAAATEAARLAAIGCGQDEVLAGIAPFLDVHGIRVGPGVRLVLLDEAGIVSTDGDGALTSPHLTRLPPADMCRAVLIVSTDVTPIPNALANYCVDYAGKQYELCAASRKLCTPCES